MTMALGLLTVVCVRYQVTSTVTETAACVAQVDEATTLTALMASDQV